MASGEQSVSSACAQHNAMWMCHFYERLFAFQYETVSLSELNSVMCVNGKVCVLQMFLGAKKKVQVKRGRGEEKKKSIGLSLCKYCIGGNWLHFNQALSRQRD